MRLKIELICPICNKSYFKDKSEYTRNHKLKRKNYCSINCSAKDTFERKLPKEKRSNYNISQHSNNAKDEFTDFRYVFKTLKIRMRKECKISLQDLKEIWELQKGICPYTGIQLKLMKHGKNFSDISLNRFEIASLDRIDSSKGYEKNNLCFVSIMINFMKNNLSVKDTVSFMRIITNYMNLKTNEDIIYSVEKYTNL